MSGKALSDEKQTQIERVSWMIHGALGQLSEMFGLSTVERCLVLERLHHCSVQSAGRVLSLEEKVLLERGKAEVIAHAEAVYAENKAEDAARAAVNTSGGQA